MVNHSIQVFARVKNQGNNDKTAAFEIVKKDKKFDDIIIYNNFLQNGSTACSFRFHKVFDQKSSQEDVFNVVAKPVINSVLQGFNGTIFAYGQTGSGKTYSITGSPKNYNDRGIIPRSIQYVFAQNEKVTVKPTIYISYMEIYNEIGYDLLNSRQDNTARSLEELPRIVLLEDSTGEVHVRNLSVLPVSTEQEAMRLLFLGDTNRIIAETPMNEYSSRSHCIFTFYITFRDEPSNTVRYSKLHLVDLAGSERVCKSLTTGTALREAKHINLSLHYLQQVILALSESNRVHVPYRNSMMTYILKDSLSGNCLTAMLATLALNTGNIQETISTCRFAQRVSTISTAPVINEIRDPQKEIIFLRNTIEELRKQISLSNRLSSRAILDKNQEEQCKKEVEQFLTSSCDELRVEPSMSCVQFCFKLLKNKINSQHSELQEKRMESMRSNVDINPLKKIVNEVQENPVNLHTTFSSKSILSTHDVTETNKNITVNYLTDKQDRYYKNKRLSESNVHTSPTEHGFEKQLFDIFLKDPENSKDLDYYTRNLQKKLEMAKIYADTIDQCQKTITYIRQRLQTKSNNSVKNKLVVELEEQQKIYSRSLDDLKTVKNETYHLQSGLRKAEIKTINMFKGWLERQQSSKFSTSFSTTGSREDVDNDNCFVCKSTQNTLRNSSAKDCSCEVRVEKQIPINCCNSFHLQHPANCWTNCWAGNICLGPICQPMVVEPSQCCDSTSCNGASIRKRNSNVFNNEQNCVMLHHSNILHDPECVVRLENIVPKTRASQSCSVISHNRKFSADLTAMNEKDDKSYCCRIINSDHQFGNKYFGNDTKMIRNTESRSCYDFDNNQTVKSLPNVTEQCRCPFPFAPDVCSEREVNNIQLDAEDDSEDEGGAVKYSQEEATISDLTKETDSAEFKDFMKTVPMTGDLEIDQEIVSFYRNKFCS